MKDSQAQWWFSRLVGGYAFWSDRPSKLPGLPAFFQQQLIAQWNAFLREKYGTDAALRDAWVGLLEGESVERGTVLLLPFRTSLLAGAQREVLGLPAEAGEQRKYGVGDFNDRRGGDVVEFLVKIWLAHKAAEADAVKGFGKSARLCPLVWDTGMGYDMPSQYLHQHADAVTHVVYLRGFHHDPTHKRFPWYSGLEELPKICWDKPGLVPYRMPGKPFFVYEHQIEQPAKYRSEYPMRLAAAGAIQDWDIIVWHYFGPVPSADADKPYEQAMDYTSSEHPHPQGLHFQYDEVQMSAMRAAAEIFRQGLLEPASEPTRITFGRGTFLNMRNTLYDFPAGRLLRGTPYRYGLRLLIDPTRPSDEIVGPTVRDRDHLPTPVRPTGQITYDWQRGHLKFDAPGVAMYTGFFAQHGGPVEFANGLVFRDVRVRNPADMPYPVGADERYVTFALVTADGLPLSEARGAILSAVSTSFNSGFRLDESKLNRPLLWQWNPGATVSTGSLPVLVARVGAELAGPPLRGMRYRMLDWHLNEIGHGQVEGETLQIPADRPVFLIELSSP